MTDELAGDLAEVDVGAVRRPGGCEFLLRIASGHHQRHPVANLLRVFGILHGAEQWAGLQSIVALLQEADVVVTPDEAHVRRAVDEGRWIFQHALAHLPGKELPGDLKRFVDLDGLADVDIAVLVLRRVVQFGQGRVAGAGIIPAVAAFFGDRVQALDHLHRPLRLQFVEPYRQGGTHDAAAYEQNVHLVRFLCLNGRAAQCNGQAGQPDLDAHSVTSHAALVNANGPRVALCN